MHPHSACTQSFLAALGVYPYLRAGHFQKCPTLDLTILSRLLITQEITRAYRSAMAEPNANVTKVGGGCVQMLYLFQPVSWRPSYRDAPQQRTLHIAWGDCKCQRHISCDFMRFSEMQKQGAQGSNKPIPISCSSCLPMYRDTLQQGTLHITWRHVT